MVIKDGNEYLNLADIGNLIVILGRIYGPDDTVNKKKKEGNMASLS